MKKTMGIMGVMGLMLTGCYAPATYPLQPGERIVFESQERANEYRTKSGNDQAGTNAVVEITRPCAVTCE
jgi:hypothetical protein